MAGWARTASADVSSRLVYTRDRVAADCPSERALRAAVEQRLGYDPFDTAAASAVIFGVRADHKAFVVRIERIDDQGVSLGVRELRSRGEGCDELVQAAALSLSIALDPVAASQVHPVAPPPAEAPAPPPESPPVVILPLVVAAVPTEPARDRAVAPSPPPRPSLLTGWHLGAFAENAWGVAPGATGGGAVHGGVGVRHGSLDLEAHYEAPGGEAAAQGGTVRSWLIAASLVPCGRLGLFSLCGVAALGRLQASSTGVTSPETRNAAFASLGGRLGLEVPLTPLLAFAVHGELAGNVTRATFQLDGTPAWRAPALLGGFAAGAVVHFR